MPPSFPPLPERKGVLVPLYWVKEADIDGFRCDMAGMVPTDFWEEAREALDSVKPVFMLAEAWEIGRAHV